VLWFLCSGEGTKSPTGERKMKSEQTNSQTNNGFANSLLHGDCIELLSRMASNRVDFVLTDPPYVAHYSSRDGRSVPNDNNCDWVKPAFQEIYRVLRWNRFCVSFYGWHKADLFIAAWRAAGFRLVGHIVFRKRYASSVRFLRCQHELAYLLAKGEVTPPVTPLPDVLDWPYTGNRFHPTQKPVEALKPLIRAFCPKDGLVLDPFCGSGSTLVAAKELGRNYVGIEIEGAHCRSAARRVEIAQWGAQMTRQPWPHRGSESGSRRR
jgi:adenine-specific DNA-methyltransferase